MYYWVLLFERLFSVRCVWRWMFEDVGMRWEDTYFKGQVGVEYGWVNDLWLFGWFLCLFHPYISWTFMVISLVSVLFYAVLCKGSVCDPNLAQHCANPSHTLHHPEGCGLCKVHKWHPCSSQSNSDPWKNHSKSGVRKVKEERVHYPGQNMLLFCVEIIVVASSVAALGWQKKEVSTQVDLQL